jgi:hypothetical protein
VRVPRSGGELYSRERVQPALQRPARPWRRALSPDTAEGRAERLAYYEARKLNQLPHSMLDYHDVRRGRETPTERRAREGGAGGRRR